VRAGARRALPNAIVLDPQRDVSVSYVLEAIIGLTVIALLLAAGFWFTRGRGGVPGGIGDPAHEELAKYSALGERLPEPGTDEPEDRERQVE
jgi:hypothetical protein